LYAANAVIRNLLFFRKKKKGGSHIRNIIIKAETIKKILYGAKITGEILLLNRYCHQKNPIKRKSSYYYRKNVINENKKSIITGTKIIKKYYYRENVGGGSKKNATTKTKVIGKYYYRGNIIGRKP